MRMHGSGWWVARSALTAVCIWMVLVGLALAADDNSAEPSPKQSELKQSEWEQVEFFERSVRPLLLEKCASCHSQSVGKVMGGLNLDSRTSLLEGGESGPTVDLEHPSDSLLLEAVRRESFEMPPDQPLSRSEIEILERWVMSGAVWPEIQSESGQSADWVSRRADQHWAWRPIEKPPVPAVQERSWSASPIDAFVRRELGNRGLDPVGRASDLDLLRRLCFDLTGLPPTRRQQAEYSAAVDHDPGLAYEKLVDDLLASPQFGVQWGRHWLDLMRYAETLGHEFDYPIRHAWRYRDAVVDAVNDDLDFDRLVIEHLAGDCIAAPRLHPATGINQSLAMTGWWWMGDSVHAPVDIRADYATRLENQVDVLSKSFLGMTVACARCHDHKFDAISVEDYYGLVGIARSTRRRYAITDPLNEVARHRDEIKQEVLDADSVAGQQLQEVSLKDIEQWLERVLETCHTLSDKELEQKLPINSPLVPLRLLVASAQTAGNNQPRNDQPSNNQPSNNQPLSDDELQFARRLLSARESIESAAKQFDHWSQQSTLLADFGDGLPAGWSFEAVQSDDWFNAPPQFDWFGAELPIPARQNVFTSGLLGRSQQLALRSPDFLVTRPMVCLKMRGKSTQSSISVSGYFMGEFHGLLFGDMRKPIDQPEDWGWVVHSGDLKKYQGQNAYLSFENEPSAWFEIAEVRLADRAPPPEPHSWAIDLLRLDAASPGAFRAVSDAALA
jgi:hypothetical protein